MQALSATPSLYLQGVPDEWGVRDVMSMFQLPGGNPVVEAYFVCHRKDGTSGTQGARRSAIVKFNSWSDAETCMEAVESQLKLRRGSAMHGGSIVVRYARPRTGVPGSAGISPRRLFLGQLPKRISEVEIERTFSAYGDVEEVNMLFERGNSSSGCAFVQFSTWKACDAAIAGTDGKHVFDEDQGHGRPLVVRYAKARSAWSPTSTLSGSHGYEADFPQLGGYECDAFAGGYPLWSPYHLPFIGYPMYIPHTTQGSPGAEHHLHHVLAVGDGYVGSGGFQYNTSNNTCIQEEDADSRKIFVGQLPHHINESQLRALFSQFGGIEKAIILHKQDGSSQGCGFVTYEHRYQAAHAIQAMHGAFPGSGIPESASLVVKFATKRSSPASSSSL